MKNAKHLPHLILTFLFLFMIGLPFLSSDVKVDTSILGVSEQKDYYKNVNYDIEKVMLRTLKSENHEEYDFISLSLSNEQTSYYPLYELTNVSEERINFSLIPGQEILGSMDGKKVFLRVSGNDQLLYKNMNKLYGNPIFEFSLMPQETVSVGISIESNFATESSSPLSFDLTLKQK